MDWSPARKVTMKNPAVVQIFMAMTAGRAVDGSFSQSTGEAPRPAKAWLITPGLL
jgi:hypothetical protein